MFAVIGVIPIGLRIIRTVRADLEATDEDARQRIDHPDDRDAQIGRNDLRTATADCQAHASRHS